MSKAFTSEETPDLGPVVRPPPRLAPGEIRYVTPEGQAALREALARLRAERAAAAALPDAERAGAPGGAGRPRRRAGRDARAPSPCSARMRRPRGRWRSATWVTVEEEDGRRATWRIVGPDESDARRGLVSVDAPLSRALLGRRAGDEVELLRPGGPVDSGSSTVRKTPPA